MPRITLTVEVPRELTRQHVGGNGMTPLLVIDNKPLAIAILQATACKAQEHANNLNAIITCQLPTTEEDALALTNGLASDLLDTASALYLASLNVAAHLHVEQSHHVGSN